MEPEDMVKMAEKLGADEAEIFWIRSLGTEISIENNEVDFGGGGASTGYAARIVKDEKIGFSYFSDRNVEKGIESAIKLSKLGKRIKGYSLPDSDDYPEISGVYDEEVAAYTPEKALERTREMLKAARDIHEKMVVAGGGFGYGMTEYYVYNSRGSYAEGKETSIGAGIYVVLQDRSVSNASISRVSHLDDLSFADIGKDAGERALMTQGAKKLEKGGEMKVLFTPECFSHLIEYTTVPQLYGNRANRGESAYKPEMMGSEIASPSLSLYDDQTNPLGLYTGPSDDEGVPSRKLPLIENGVLRSFMYDTVSATEFGAESTGNGMRSGARFKSSRDSTPPETVARNISLEFPSKKEFEEMVGEIDRGLVVYSVLGAHTSNAVTGDISVNSPSLMYIEKGEMKYPIASAMIAGNSTEMLKNVIAVSRDARPIEGDISGMSFIMPYVLVDRIKVA